MASTSSPIRRNTSASVRTVVVLPVPPFSDRTAIVSAIWREDDTERLFGERRRRRGGRSGRDRVEEEDRMAPDRDLVAVGQRAPLHPLAVDEDAVERPVVEHTHALALADHERVPA